MLAARARAHRDEAGREGDGEGEAWDADTVRRGGGGGGDLGGRGSGPSAGDDILATSKQPKRAEDEEEEEEARWLACQTPACQFRGSSLSVAELKRDSVITWAELCWRAPPLT